MRAPGFEPGSERWQRSILPLNYACFIDNLMNNNIIINKEYTKKN